MPIKGVFRQNRCVFL